jgi:ferritin-like metal-binding protein YciE
VKEAPAKDESPPKNPNGNELTEDRKGVTIMPVKNTKELFVALLSDVRQNTERAGKIYQEISQMAHDPQVREALEARAFISSKTLEKLDQCFKLIGEQPMKLSGRLQEVFIDDFKKELQEIHSPEARNIHILAKLVHLTQLRIGEYVALVAAADITGHYAVGVLLESCLGEKMAFVERTRRLMHHIVQERIAERRAA